MESTHVVVFVLGSSIKINKLSVGPAITFDSIDIDADELGEVRFEFSIPLGMR